MNIWNTVRMVAALPVLLAMLPVMVVAYLLKFAAIQFMDLARAILVLGSYIAVGEHPKDLSDNPPQ